MASEVHKSREAYRVTGGKLQRVEKDYGTMEKECISREIHGEPRKNIEIPATKLLISRSALWFLIDEVLTLLTALFSAFVVKEHHRHRCPLDTGAPSPPDLRLWGSLLLYNYRSTKTETHSPTGITETETKIPTVPVGLWSLVQPAGFIYSPENRRKITGEIYGRVTPQMI